MCRIKVCLSFLVFLIFAAAGPIYATKIYDEDGDGIFENLRERLSVTPSGETVPVLIVYKDATPLAGTFATRLSHIPSNQVKYSYRNVPAVAAAMTAAQIAEAQKDPWIEHIELDGKISIALNKARSSFGVQALKTQFAFTGDGDGIKNNFSIDDVVIAVIDTGVRKVVFVEVAEGRFQPRELSLGRKGETHYEVLEGLAAGERVVVSAQFLLDSESRLRGVVRPTHGAH